MTTRDREARRPLAVPSTRIGRLAHLGAMTAGVAGNMAVGGMRNLTQGQRSSARELLLTPANITRIARQLAQMRGAAMKVGQLMSMDSGDVLPPELAVIMARLRDDAYVMPPAQLKQVLRANWPDGWQRAFVRFDVRPMAAASIGQVHRARLRDGTELAVKVQYPGVARSIDSDVANVGALIRMSGLIPKGVDPGPYLEAARVQLHEETDYTLEARHLARFGALLKDDDRFRVPQVRMDWTTPQILSMSYLEGRPVEVLGDLPRTRRDAVARDLIALTLSELFDFALMQSDPNFANYRHDEGSGRIVLLDFGATRVIAPRIVDLYRQFMRAGMAGDDTALAGVAREIGFFDDTTRESHRALILRMIGRVFFELRKDGMFDFRSNPMPHQVRDEGMILAAEGFAPPPLPIDVLFLQRKFAGMFLLASRLGARVDVRGLILDHIGA